MPVGDIRISSLKVGDIDLTNFSQATYSHFNIYEDILSPYGPACDITVIDHSDALGKTKLTGSFDKDIEISFSLAENVISGSKSFKFKFLENKNVKDNSFNSNGGDKYKQYEIRGVTKEMLNAQGQYVVKSYDRLTSDIVEDVLKNNFKTDKQIEIQEQTKGKRRLNFNNEHPLQVIRKLNAEHVSTENESSAFVVFQQDDKYLFTSFEKLFQQQPVVKLTHKPSLDYSGTPAIDKQNSIIWINVADSFFTPSRPLNNASEQTVNLTTHGVVSTKPNPTDFYTAQGKGRMIYKGKVDRATEMPVRTTYDKVNDKQRHSTAEARRKRTEFTSHLAQNSAELEIPGNPNIKLGSIIELEIPKKAVTEQNAGESQFNGKALVVAIRHKIKPLGAGPRYTMVLKVVKASYKDNSSGNA